MRAVTEKHTDHVAIARPRPDFINRARLSGVLSVKVYFIETVAFLCGRRPLVPMRAPLVRVRAPKAAASRDGTHSRVNLEVLLAEIMREHAAN